MNDDENTAIFIAAMSAIATIAIMGCIIYPKLAYALMLMIGFCIPPLIVAVLTYNIVRIIRRKISKME